MTNTTISMMKSMVRRSRRRFLKVKRAFPIRSKNRACTTYWANVRTLTSVVTCTLKYQMFRPPSANISLWTLATTEKAARKNTMTLLRPSGCPNSQRRSCLLWSSSKLRASTRSKKRLKRKKLRARFRSLRMCRHLPNSLDSPELCRSFKSLQRSKFLSLRMRRQHRRTFSTLTK